MTCCRCIEDIGKDDVGRKVFSTPCWWHVGNLSRDVFLSIVVLTSLSASRIWFPTSLPLSSTYLCIKSLPTSCSVLFLHQIPCLQYKYDLCRFNFLIAYKVNFKIFRISPPYWSSLIPHDTWWGNAFPISHLIHQAQIESSRPSSWHSQYLPCNHYKKIDLSMHKGFKRYMKKSWKILFRHINPLEIGVEKNTPLEDLPTHKIWNPEILWHLPCTK